MCAYLSTYVVIPPPPPPSLLRKELVYLFWSWLSETRLHRTIVIWQMSLSCGIAASRRSVSSCMTAKVRIVEDIHFVGFSMSDGFFSPRVLLTVLSYITLYITLIMLDTLRKIEEHENHVRWIYLTTVLDMGEVRNMREGPSPIPESATVLY